MTDGYLERIDLLSIIIPAFNEEGNVERTALAVGKAMAENNIDHELVFVNDGSSDRTWEKMKALAEKESKVIFGGRLGEYKYYDMDAVIASALDLCKREL